MAFTLRKSWKGGGGGLNTVWGFLLLQILKIFPNRGWAFTHTWAVSAIFGRVTGDHGNWKIYIFLRM